MKTKPTITYHLPDEIEKRSFEIIEEELGNAKINPQLAPIIKRVIHTSADFDYLEHLCFSKDVVPHAIEVLKRGACIVTDTQMAKAGINKKVLETLGGEVFCFISDEDVMQEAKRQGTTRAQISMERAVQIQKPLIFAIGNAPTALMKLYDLIETGFKPQLIIGVPVGFVNVVESKELIMETDIPYIIAKGRKGGSNVAAAICNALLYEASKDTI